MLRPPDEEVVAFAAMMYADRRGEFERFTLKDALGAREVLLAALADRRPAYLLWFADALRAGGGGARLDAFFAELRAREDLHVGAEPIVTYPPRRFSDPMHVDEKGAVSFSAELATEVARLYGYAR